MRRNGGGRGMEREGLDCRNLRENAQARWWTGDGKGKRDNKGTQAGDYGTWQIKKSLFNGKRLLNTAKVKC